MNHLNYQAGAYEPQYGYQSFMPSSVHHAWEFSDGALLRLLGEADRLLGELNAFSQLVPDIEFFIKTYVAKEATQSSRIEGTQTSIEDAFRRSEDLQPEKRDDWAEVQNYIQAINFAVARLSVLPLSNRLLRETHAILMSGVRGKHKMPGEFRTSQNWIGVSLKDAVFIPPHFERVPALMSDLEKFLHDEEHPVPPLIKIAIAHYQFETIHPFLDGNGRLGRLMISLFLASHGLLAKPALYLSDYFERHKTAYVDKLMAVREGHHLHHWLVFFLHGVKETAQSSIGIFRAILQLKERIEREVMPQFSPRRQNNAHALLKHLYGQPVVDINDVVTLLGKVSVNTAGDLVKDLVKHGVLKEVTGYRRNRWFVFDEYLKLFAP